MRKLITLFVFFMSLMIYGQVEKTTLQYKPPGNINGLTPVNVNLSYTIKNVFGDIMIVFDANCNGDLTYQYKGREYNFTGSDGPIRSIRVVNPIIRVRITGPNNFKKEVKLWVTGMGGSAFGDSVTLLSSKTKEEKDPNNYKVEVLYVESVTYENTYEITSVIEQKIKEEEKKNEIQKLTNEANNAYDLKKYIEAENKYNKIIKLDYENTNAINRLKKIADEKESFETKKRYDDIVETAREEEERGNLENAKKLYESALKENENNDFIQQQVDRIKAIQERKNQDAIKHAETIKKQIEEKDKLALEEYEKKESEKRKFYNETKKRIDEMIEAKKDSIAENLDKQIREELYAKKMALEKEEEEAIKVKEQKEADEFKEAALARRKDNNDEISKIEKFMEYDPVNYNKQIKENELLLENLLSIKPYDELMLKKEWWDNNDAIQYFSDDLYENQRRENHEKYRIKKTQENNAVYNYKNGLLKAMYYVDKGSAEQEWLLKRIEYCNKRIDYFDSDYKYDFNSESIRIKQRNFIKSYNKGIRESKYQVKAQSAYEMLNLTTGNQNIDGLKVYELSQRMKEAHMQYEQDLAITGVSQSIVNSTIFNNNLSVKDDIDHYMFNFHLSTGYINVPIIMNETSDVNTPISKTDELNGILINAGMDLWYYRSKYVDVNLGLLAGYGTYPLEGIKSNFFHYSGKINVDFGYKGIKLVTLVQYLNRTGNQEIDNNVVNPNSIATNTISTGKFNYNILRVGCGLKIGSYKNYGNVTLLAYAEKPDFYEYKITDKPIYSYELQINGNEFVISFEYAPNYVIAGQKDFALPEPKNKAFYGIKIGKTWTLF